MGGVLARAQRQLGHQAWSVDYFPKGFEYFCDQVFPSPVGCDWLWKWGRFILTKALRFDVFHFYFGQSLCGPALWDVPWLKRMGKRVFFHFCGCDIRDSKHVVATHEHSACAVCWPMACSLNRLKARRVALRYADGVFVSTPDLLEFVPGAVLLPQPVDLAQLEALAQSPQASVPASRPGVDRPVRVAHAPSDRTIKGTDVIITVIERLQQRGLNVRLVLVENTSHAESVAVCNTCDLAVDQLLVGAYGQYAVEMMALGKPCLCYVRQDLLSSYPQDCPLILASVDDFEQILAEWVTHPDLWQEAGEKGKRYVKALHDANTVAKACLAAYGGNSPQEQGHAHPYADK